MIGARSILLSAVGSVTLAVVIGTAIAGCGSDQPAAAKLAPVPVPTPTSWAQLQLPIDAYELNETQTAQVQYVGQRLLQACMAKYGFTYPPANWINVTEISETVHAQQIADSRRWGISDPVAAREYGYHLPPMGSPSQQQTAQQIRMRSLPRAESTVLYGSASASSSHGQAIPVGGCTDQSTRELNATGVSQAGSMLVAEIDRNGFEKALSDSRTLAVFGQWSACMKSHGYDYSSPFQPYSSGTQTASPTSAEIQTAKADVACKMKTNLLGVTFAVESDIENQMIEQNAQALAHLKTSVAAQQRALAQLVVRYGI